MIYTPLKLSHKKALRKKQVKAKIRTFFLDVVSAM
jgi:hypothetical protein